MSQRNGSNKNKQQPKNANSTAAAATQKSTSSPAQKTAAKSKQSSPSAAAATPPTSAASNNASSAAPSSLTSGPSTAASSKAAPLPNDSSSASTAKTGSPSAASSVAQKETKSVDTSASPPSLASPSSTEQSSGSSVTSVPTASQPNSSTTATGKGEEQTAVQTSGSTCADTVIVGGAMGANESSSISKESSVDPNKKHTDDVTPSDVKTVGEISSGGNKSVTEIGRGSGSEGCNGVTEIGRGDVTGLSSTSESNQQCNEHLSDVMKDGRTGTQGTPCASDSAQLANDTPNKSSKNIQTKDDAGKILTDVMPANEAKTGTVSGSDTDTEANIADTKRIVEEFRKAVMDDLAKIETDKLTNKDAKSLFLPKAANVKLDKSSGGLTSDVTSSSKQVSSADPKTLVESATLASSGNALQDGGKVDVSAGGKELTRVDGGEAKTSADGDVDDDLEVTDIMKKGSDRCANQQKTGDAGGPASDVTPMTSQTELIMKKTFTESVQPNQEFVPIRDDVNTMQDDVTASNDVISKSNPIIAGSIDTSSEEVALGGEVEVAAKGRILSDALTQAQDLKSDLKRLQNLLDDLNHFETVVHTSAAYEIASHKPVVKRRRPQSTIEGEELLKKIHTNGAGQGEKLQTNGAETFTEQASVGEEGSKHDAKQVDVQGKEVHSKSDENNIPLATPGELPGVKNTPEKLQEKLPGLTSGELLDVSPKKSEISTEANPDPLSPKEVPQSLSKKETQDLSKEATEGLSKEATEGLSKEVHKSLETSKDTNSKCADVKSTLESEASKNDLNKTDGSQSLKEPTSCNADPVLTAAKSVAPTENSTSPNNVKTTPKCDGDPLSLL